MTEQKQNALRRIYGIFLSVFTVIVGVLLIVQSQRVYRSADSYTYEKVSEYLSQISVVLYIWIAAVIAGWIIWEIFPPKAQKIKANIPKSVLLKRLKKRLPDEMKSPTLVKAEKINAAVKYSCAALCLLSFVMVLVAVLDKHNYGIPGAGFNPTKDMLALLPEFLPWVAAAFLITIAGDAYIEHSAKKELSETKRLLVESKKNPSASVAAEKSTRTKKLPKIKIPPILLSEKFKTRLLLSLRIALPIIAVVFIVIGCINGGVNEVLTKAINICTECIGLG